MRRDTTDRIFLLSVWEVEKYLDLDIKAMPTLYAEKHGAIVHDDYCSWWTRSSARTCAMRMSYYDDSIFDDDEFSECSEDEKNEMAWVESWYMDISEGVRPALWIDLGLLKY